ncbi:MAG TPA: histone deacetylase [Myxococcaceae bacterium]|nr:histone deacetylase [Myxococcaceae bacterium]
MTTLLLSDRLFLEHLTGPEHPESPSRLEAALHALEPPPAGAKMSAPAREATRDELLRVHTPRYVDGVLAYRGRAGAIDPETPLSERSVEAALLAAGACVELTEALTEGRAENGFALVRPPGHHAESDRGMGFCVFNNVAVAAAHALARGLRRILIVDWDVHHGNGTQEIFFESPQVLFFSVHQERLFPETGAVTETGRGVGEGFKVNVPLPPGSGDREYLGAWDAFLPRAEAFRPQLVLVSAGFDAHAGDFMSALNVSTDGYVALCGRVKALARQCAEGRLGLVLEGGYDLQSLADSVRACVDVLVRP